MMQNKWCSFLRDAGANIHNGITMDFGNPGEEIQSAVNDNVIVDLSHFAIIKVTGNDATDFLHGQFTSDVNTIDKQCFQFSAWCNPKGQVLTNFLLLKVNEGFLLLLPEDIKTQLMQRLQMYILRADITLEDASKSLVRIGISFPKPSQEVKAIFEAIQAAEQMQMYKSAHLFQIQADKPRYIMIGMVEAVQPVWKAFEEYSKPAGVHTWALLDILAGLPWVTESTSAMFLPQMLNLDVLGGLSYKKGCYPGQEIITRLYQRGQVKRRVFLASTQNGPDIKTGHLLFKQDEEQPAGTIVNIAPDANGGYTMLAVVETEKAESGKIILKHQENMPLMFHPLPYSLDD